MCFNGKDLSYGKFTIVVKKLLNSLLKTLDNVPGVFDVSGAAKGGWALRK